MKGLRYTDGRLVAAAIDIPEPPIDLTKVDAFMREHGFGPWDEIGRGDVRVRSWKRTGGSDDVWLATLPGSPFIEICGWSDYLAWHALASRYYSDALFNQELEDLLIRVHDTLGALAVEGLDEGRRR